jgi:hypothetical protein
VTAPLTTGDRRLALACHGSIALAIVGVFGTWRNAGPVSLDGFEGPHNGWLVIVFALIALAGVRSLSRAGWLGIVTVLGSAAVIIFTTVENVLDDNDVLGGSPGWGVWLAIAAAAVLAAASIYAAVERIRGSTRADPTTSP